MGDTFHLRLNMTRRPIVQKYREGRLKITLKRKLKETEIAGGEAVKGPVLVEISLYRSLSLVALFQI